MSQNEQQIERIKQEALYLNLAKRYNIPEDEAEKQINLYLDNLKRLMDNKDKEY